jgi:hypothetical protein
MRFLIYFIALAAIIYLGVLIVQVALKRITSDDITRKSDLRCWQELAATKEMQLNAIQKYCDSAVLVNEQDLTALYVLHIIQGEKTA